MGRKGKQERIWRRRHSAQIAPEGELRECAHPPCRTQTTDQFCIAHSLQAGVFARRFDGAPVYGKRG